MSKAGRKKLISVHREPNGRRQRPRVAETSVYWQRERDALRAISRSPELESPLGVLLRANMITPKQMGAAIRFAAERKDADAALSLPARDCQAQDIVNVKGGNGREDDDRAARRKANDIRDYDMAEDAVGRGSRELAALQRVVVYGHRPDDHSQFIALCEGLTKLSAFYDRRGA